MRLADSEHCRRKWRVRTLAPDFDLWDVWGIPVAGDREAFGAFVRFYERLLDGGVVRRSRATSLLFRVRGALGRVFRWDDQLNRLPVPGCSETSLRSRLPQEKRPSDDTGPAPADYAGFRNVYRLHDECLYELSNATVHALMHLGWVQTHGGSYAPQLAVYIKPRGLRGRAYLALISPFRRYIVYPSLMRSIAAAWLALQK